MSIILKRISSIAPMVRCIQATTVSHKSDWTFIEKLDFNFSIYKKYGLLKDDMIRDYDPDVKEAIERMPQEMQMQRLYRAIRANQLFLEHNVLPESEWSKLEDDHDYLQPYLKEVIAERLERYDWEKNH